MIAFAVAAVPHTCSCTSTSRSASVSDSANAEDGSFLSATGVVVTRLRARVAYDGTNFNGWQYQAKGRTVQGVLETALHQRLGVPARVVGSSRTDAGVHARGQAMHMDVPTSHLQNNNEQRLQYALNGLLPHDVRLRALSKAPGKNDEGYAWHAIYRARGKRYSYRFSVNAVHDPVGHAYRMHDHRFAHKGFREDCMRRAMSYFEGTNDFTAFANASSLRPSERKRSSSGGLTKRGIAMQPVRIIHSLCMYDEGFGNFRLEFEISGALYRMIRNIVGTLLAVAAGQIEADQIPVLFDARNRANVPKSAPAKGLCLDTVYFEDDDNWPS